MAVPLQANTPVEEYLAAILAELVTLNATMEALAQRASSARVVTPDPATGNVHSPAPSTPTAEKKRK